MSGDRKRPMLLATPCGFTLIELSIVLVIIGLLVGGVLVGQSMIQASYARKAAKDIEELKTSLNTFKMKYGCDAGDCNNTSQFLTGCTSNCDGNGNGVYDSGDEASNRLFYHLQMAGLPFHGNYNNASTTNGNVFPGINVPLPDWLNANGGGSLYVTDFTWDPTNWGVGGCESFQPWMADSRNLFPGRKIVIDGVTGGNGFTCMYGGNIKGVSRTLAIALDQKFDDGMPYSGHIQAPVQYPYTNDSCADANGYLTAPGWAVTWNHWADMCLLGLTVQ